MWFPPNSNGLFPHPLLELGYFLAAHKGFLIYCGLEMQQEAITKIIVDLVD